MTQDGPPAPARRRGRGLAIPIVVPAIAFACAYGATAAAQEPLVIRIRPRPEPGAEATLAAREALWARRQAHARAVLASICTGCLRPWEPSAAAARPIIAHTGPITALAGLETDPVPGASGPPPDPATTQERP